MGCPAVGVPLFLPLKMVIMRYKLWAFFAQIKAQIRRIINPEHGYLIPSGVLRSILGADKGRF